MKGLLQVNKILRFIYLASEFQRNTEDFLNRISCCFDCHLFQVPRTTFHEYWTTSIFPRNLNIQVEDTGLVNFKTRFLRNLCIPLKLPEYIPEMSLSVRYLTFKTYSLNSFLFAFSGSIKQAVKVILLLSYLRQRNKF